MTLEALQLSSQGPPNQGLKPTAPARPLLRYPAFGSV